MSNARDTKAAGSRQPRPPRRVSQAQLDKLAAARTQVVVPEITFPEALPVSARRRDIAAAIAGHQVVVIAGETGSGKTTQIPKILLEMGRGRLGQIGHTQPRRIAARSVAERIAFELGVPLGELVGYQVRFTDQSSEKTLVKVMTDGILLAQIQRDPDLLAYDTIVIDEAHERSLNIDFLLGYLSRLLPRRPDLKLVITSATIDSERFAAHFSPAHLAQLGGAPSYVIEALPDTAPVVEVTGRTYPVEIRFRPLAPDLDPETGLEIGGRRAKAEEKDLLTGIIEACDELMRVGEGDILVFCSGEREIRDAIDALEGHLGARARDERHPQYVELLPLYSRLSAAEQHRVFASHLGRRIVLATNVAETSLTVPGIHYVVDTGVARISRYSKATKVQRLPIEPISRASANQRSGRCGRVADGVAIRLYSETDFAARPEFTEPEILRTSLASVLLAMISVGVVKRPDDVAQFPFVEAPDTRAIRDGVLLLRELGAIETKSDSAAGSGATRLTAVGRQLAHLPMDPRLARMVIAGVANGVAHPVLVIAAALSMQDVRERPVEQREQADQLHARFTDPTSDFLTFLNLWEYLREQQRDLSSSAFRRLCRAEFLNWLRIREWQDLVAQIRQVAAELGLDLSRPRDVGLGLASVGRAKVAGRVYRDQASGRNQEDRPVNGLVSTSSTDAPQAASHRRGWDGDAIHKSLLAGLLSQLGMQDAGEVKASSVAHLRGEARARALKQAAKRMRNEYLGARGARFAIFPGSPLSKKPPAWIMAAELVETSRLWARCVARITPEWAEPLAGDLARRTYSEPHWSKRQGAAVAIEKVLLYGVPIIADRKVLYGKINPAEARELFIRHALVEGDWTTHHKFFAENRRLLDEAEDLAARTRERGLVATEDDLFDFYDERIPDSVISAAHFDKWWQRERRRKPALLTFRLEDLVDVSAVDPAAFPAGWTQGDLTLPLTYQFDPGAAADGVTLSIPLSVLPRVAPAGFDWMVPGLLDELCVATIRSLPKAVRVQLVPAPDVGSAVANWLRANTPVWEDMARAGDMAEPFHLAFARAVRALRELIIPDDVWDTARVERLPAHLRMTFRVVDEKGRELDSSKELLALQRRLAAKAEDAVRAAVKGAVGRALQEAAAAAEREPESEADGLGSTVDRARAVLSLSKGRDQAPQGLGHSSSLGLVEQSNLSTWPEFPGGVLPDVVESALPGGVIARGYPSLVEERGPKGSVVVGLRILADAAVKASTHARGVRRLLLNENCLATGRVISRWGSTQSLALAVSPYRSTDALVEDLQLAATIALTSPVDEMSPSTPRPDDGVSLKADAIRDADAYAVAKAYVRQHLEDETFRIAGEVASALSALRELEAAIKATSSLALLNTLQQIRNHASALIYDGFVSATPPRRLAHLQRYLRAALHRLEKAAINPHRDAQLAWQVSEVESELAKAKAAYASGSADPARAATLADARWLIEELRVSLFAQQLGTDGPVSDKRILKLLRN